MKVIGSFTSFFGEIIDFCTSFSDFVSCLCILFDCWIASFLLRDHFAGFLEIKNVVFLLYYEIYMKVQKEVFSNSNSEKLL